MLLALSQFDLRLSDIGIKELLNVQVSRDETRAVQVVVVREPLSPFLLHRCHTIFDVDFAGIYLYKSVFFHILGNIDY